MELKKNRENDFSGMHIRRISKRISGFCQPAQELSSFIFADDDLFAKRYIEVKGEFTGKEAGYIYNGFAANEELPVGPEK